MNAIKHIALLLGIVCFGLGGIPRPAWAGSSMAVFLEIPEGNTAFVIDETVNTAWWVTGECRREMPLEIQNNQEKQIFKTQKSSKTVTIGSRQMKLQQQFRFNLAPLAASVDVYSSVRGGWSSIPAHVNTACALEAACLARMELPEC